MDISAFSDDDFDTLAWVNNILNNAENEKKENYTMSLVMKLQLYVQQVNSNLEQTSEQVLESLPKIIQDIRALQEEAQVLKGKMAVVKDEVIKIEQDTGKSIANIERLDTGRTKLTEAKQGLHESDNWTVLVNEMEELFDIKNIDAIATKLNSMQTSLKLLINVSDYEDRKLQLEGLKNRLEAIASPAIVQAFTENNAEQGIIHSRIFLSIGRTRQLLKYYHKCQRDILLKKWRDQLDVEQDETVAVWVHNFYDILLSNWHTQHKWFCQVFPTESVSITIIDLYADVLHGLDPSIEECIEAALKQTTDKLLFLLEVKQITKQFVTNFLVITDSKDTSTTTFAIYQPFLLAIYRPLSIHLRNYVTYERTDLLARLPILPLDHMTDTSPADIVAAVGRAGSIVLDSIGDARRRCDDLTEQCGYCGLLVAVRVCLVAHADQYRVAVKHLDRNRLKGEDWSTFQLCFSLLQNAGEMLLNINQLEVDLTTSVLKLQRNTTSIDYHMLLLNKVDRKELQSLIRCVTEGQEIALLDHVTSDWSKLCADIHHLIGQVALAPALRQLETVQRASTWTQYAQQGASSADAPDYSFTPQEYITEIGQYLMTLPQHLEPFLFRENPALTCAFRAARPEYNRAYITNPSSVSNPNHIEGEAIVTSAVDSAAGTTAALTNVFLGVILKSTCQAYSDAILNICELNAGSSRQLAHDIGYLGNIVEDLGLSLTDSLQQISSLLKIPTDQYMLKSAGYSARHVAAIRQIRNITSS